VDTVTVKVSFPREKLIDRDAVKLAGLFDRYPAAAHCLNDRRLAPNRPALARLR
jgi:hypothetical protein